jgi:hypothetical protein
MLNSTSQPLSYNTKLWAHAPLVALQQQSKFLYFLVLVLFFLFPIPTFSLLFKLNIFVLSSSFKILLFTTTLFFETQFWYVFLDQVQNCFIFYVSKQYLLHNRTKFFRSNLSKNQHSYSKFQFSILYWHKNTFSKPISNNNPMVLAQQAISPLSTRSLLVLIMANLMFKFLLLFHHTLGLFIHSHTLLLMGTTSILIFYH